MPLGLESLQQLLVLVIDVDCWVSIAGPVLLLLLLLLLINLSVYISMLCSNFMVGESKASEPLLRWFGVCSSWPVVSSADRRIVLMMELRLSARRLTSCEPIDADFWLCCASVCSAIMTKELFLFFSRHSFTCFVLGFNFYFIYLAALAARHRVPCPTISLIRCSLLSLI